MHETGRVSRAALAALATLAPFDIAMFCGIASADRDPIVQKTAQQLLW